MGWSNGYQHTPTISVHFLMDFHFPRGFPCLCLQNKILRNQDTAFFLLPSLSELWRVEAMMLQAGVLLWAHGQGVWVVTLFNPLVKHMAKQLLPIHVLQQLPSALLSAAPAAGEAREERGVSCSVHQTLITACLRNVCLRNPEAFLWVAALKLSGKCRCFFY